MGGIVTVTGVLAPDGAGTCSVGEHLVARLAGERPALATDTWFFEQTVRMELLGDLMLGRANRDDATLDAEEAELELTRFAEAGGGLVVEVTGPEAGRRPNALRALSVRSGVGVVMAARATRDVAALVAELVEGVEGVRAGVIHLVDFDAAEAAWTAARQTGAPVLVATGGDAGRARQAVEGAKAAGLGAGRLALGGLAPLAQDVPGLLDLAKTGAYLAFDRLGRIPTIRTKVSDHDIGVAVAALVSAGHGGQVLLGTGLDSKHAMTPFGGNGLRFIPKQYLPYLGMLGVAPEAAQLLGRGNAQKFLTWAEGAA